MRVKHLFALCALGSVASVWGQFQGPSILSRPASQIGRDANEPAEFRVHAGVNGVYESNVLVPGTDANGAQSTASLEGVEATFGILGSKAYRHTVVGLSYEGSYRAYSGNTFYNGTDHLLALEIQHQFSKKWSLSVRPTGGTLSRSTGGILASGYTDPSVYGLPSSEILDNRVYFAQGSADLTYQATPRLSFNLGGDGFFVRRSSSSLIGVDGSSARADVAYRITKKQTIGGEYQYLHFTYDRAFGTYDAHMISAIYSNQLTSRWQLNLRAGGYRVESLGLQVVQLDPTVAGILGTNVGVGVGYGVHYLPAFDAVLHRTTKHGDLFFTYDKKLNPGNGILALSRDEVALVSYSQNLNAKLNVGFSGGYERLHGISELGAAFDSYTAGGGFAYQFWRYAYLTGRLDWRQYELVSGLFDRGTYRAVLGVQFTSADTPIRMH